MTTLQTLPARRGPFSWARLGTGMRRSLCVGWTVLIGLGWTAAPALASDSSAGSGLRTQIDRAGSDRLATPWSARFGWSEAAQDSALASPVTARLSWQWLGDYHFAPAWGLRATGGVRGQFDLAAPSGGRSNTVHFGGVHPGSGTVGSDGNWTSPYLGLGYDASASLRNGWGGWGLSADLGLQTRRPSGLRLGSNGYADEGWRSMRLTPVLQVGVSYSF